MALVDYSGSESSEEEDEATIQRAVTKLKPSSSKPAFQRLVDRSDPHKIRVSLPETSKPNPDDEENEERPTKRAKIGSGGMGGFNALLPAPKRAAAANGRASLGGPRVGGLGSGVNLKTGAAPGFCREPEQSLAAVEEDQTDGNTAKTGAGAQDGKSEGPDRASPAVIETKHSEEPKPKSNSTIFKPLSVTRKPQKKKATPTGYGNAIAGANGQREEKSKPKVSLFSTGDVNQRSREESVRNGEYQPMVYHADAVDSKLSLLDAPGDIEGDLSITFTSESIAATPTLQSLDSIASDLNLSKSAKRQLLGRQKNNGSAVNIVNFNIDEEYKANEDIRRSGEQVQHNAVRAIAPGKHSLKQLVNMGTAQAEALEESFASGRRNRSEAGSKYGW